MFLKNRDEDLGLENVISRLQSQMQPVPPDSEQYAKMVTHLAALYKMKDTKSSRRVSPDTWAIIGANLAGILVIVGYEKANVVTSKALSFVSKLR